MLKRNLNTAFRKLFRNKEFTIINVFGLLIGISTSLFILLWVNDEVNYDRHHKDLDRIYGIWHHMNYSNGVIATGTGETASIKSVLESDYPEVESVARYRSAESAQLSVNGKDIKSQGAHADAEFFEIFNFDLLDGDITRTGLQIGNNIVLTEQMAVILFGKNNVAGETIRFDNEEDFLVLGVVSNPPKNSRFQFEYVTSMEGWVENNNWSLGWGNGAVNAFVKLRPGTSADSFTDKISGIANARQEGLSKDIFLKPFGEIYLYGDYEDGVEVGGRIEYVRLFITIASFILLIACINFVNLSIADSFKRAKEVGVRKVIGASKIALAKQFLIESGLLVLLSFLLSIIAVEMLLPVFNNFTGKAITFNWMDLTVLVKIGSLALVIIIIAGLYPALVLSGFRTIEAMKGKLDMKGANVKGAILRKGLVMFQFVVAGFLIFATLVVGNQIEYIFNNDKNVDREGVIVLQNDYELINRYESFRTQLLKSPFIQSVTSMGEMPINVRGNTSDPTWEGKDPQNDATSFRILFGEQDFITAMNLEIVDGRDFSRELKSDSASIILNEAAIRGMHLTEPLGKIVKFWGLNAKIIGVVKDFHLNSIYDEIQPLILLNWVENTQHVAIRAVTGQESAALKTLEETYAQFMPGYVFDYRFMADAHRDMYQNELLIEDLAKLFGGIAILISCLGLFGLTSLNAQRSVKEIGIRKVLGASISNILIRFSKQSLIIPAIALLVMMPIAFIVMKGWLENFEYHVEVSLTSLISVVILSLSIAWLTVSFIAFRSARMNPVESLRNE